VARREVVLLVTGAALVGIAVLLQTLGLVEAARVAMVERAAKVLGAERQRLRAHAALAVVGVRLRPERPPLPVAAAQGFSGRVQTGLAAVIHQRPPRAAGAARAEEPPEPCPF
jgi:hypothetical protein